MGPGSGYRRNWDGEDGHYEVTTTGVRDKWNPYSVVHESRSVQWHKFQGVVDQAFPGNDPIWVDWDITVGIGLNSSSPFLTFNANDELKLQSRLAEKVKAHNFNLMVNVAQAGQLVGMIEQNLRKFGRAALALRRGDFATAARQFGTTRSKHTTQLKAKDVSGRWLELQYGWLPALSDTYEAAKAFHAISEGPRKSIVRASIKKEAEFEGSQSPTSYSSLGHETLTRRLVYEMSEEMSAARSLGLYDPLTLAWEVLPYSFVVDWFVPIGTYLENLSIIPFLKGRFSESTLHRWKSGPIFLTETFNGHKHRVEKPLPASSYRVTALNRVVGTSLTPPLPEMNLKGSLSGLRVANAISLAYQAFLGKPQRRLSDRTPPRGVTSQFEHYVVGR
jgi:hypothetical protein